MAKPTLFTCYVWILFTAFVLVMAVVATVPFWKPSRAIAIDVEQLSGTKQGLR